jgi:hypothetical protein
MVTVGAGRICPECREWHWRAALFCSEQCRIKCHARGMREYLNVVRSSFRATKELRRCP